MPQPSNLNPNSSKDHVSRVEPMNHDPHTNHHFFMVQWFSNLPIRQKQLIGLFTSEFISIVGLIGVSSYLIIRGIREQANYQAQAELAVTQVNYNIKIDQMGFGFRGQSDNLAIIQAAQSYQDSKTVTPQLQTQVQEILQNEIRSRNIEYATLVGTDLKIIANANQNRRGDVFNPHNLVRDVLENPRQIQSSEIITQQELKLESPPNLSKINAENALIRYTITPIISRKNQAVIGILVSGDVINGKADTWDQSLDALRGGYTAVYSIPVNQKPELAISLLEIQDNLGSRQSLAVDVPLSNSESLSQVIATPGQVTTQHLKVQDQYYTVAATTLNNFAGNPVAVLIRGTPKHLLDQLLQQTLSLQFLVSLVALIVDIILAIFLARTIARPIQRLKIATQEFSAGNLQARAEVLSKDEVGELAITYNQMAERILKAFQKEQKSLKEKYQLNSSLRKQVAIRQESEKQLKKLLIEKEVLVKEIHHRVKNNLLIVCNLLEFQAEFINNDQLTQALEESRNRIYSMALIHEKLYGSNNLVQIDFAEYIEQLVDYLSETYNNINSNITVDLQLKPIFLSIETVNPCGLIINELISNAFKHAFPDGREGKIEVKLRTLEQTDKILLTVADNGVGLPPNLSFQNLDSLGMELIETLTTQLEGNLELFRENGTIFQLTFSELKYKQQDELINF